MRLALGVIGLGRGLMLTLPSLSRHPGIRIAAAADPDADARAAFANMFGVPTYADAETMLAADAIDAVYIASPHRFHAEQAIAAARAGRHVLVEKPMATSLADARAMVAAAAQAGTALVVGPSHGFDAPIDAAARLIADGAIGSVRMVTALYTTDFLYRPRDPRELADAHGVILAQGTHQVDVVRRLVNRAAMTVSAVTGDWDSSRAGPGAYQALIRFEGGAAASLSYGGYGRFDGDTLMGGISELGHVRGDSVLRRRVGDDGSSAKRARGFTSAFATSPDPAFNEHFGFVLVQGDRGDLRLGADGVTIHDAEGAHFVAVARPEPPRARVIDALVAAARDPGASQEGQWGLETTACCLAIARSAELGREIKLSELMEFDPT